MARTRFFRVAVLAQNLGSFGGMLAVGRMVVIGPALVVEVVQKGGDAPGVLVGVMLAGVCPDASLHGQHMFAQTFRLRVFAEQIPGIFAGRHGSSLVVEIKNRADIVQRMRWCSEGRERCAGSVHRKWCKCAETKSPITEQQKHNL